MDELEISSSNLSKVLYNLVLLDQNLKYSSDIIRPAIKILYESINEGYFDSDMKRVDWFDIKELVDQM